jgi:cytochrome c biogenesis protein CcdA
VILAAALSALLGTGPVVAQEAPARADSAVIYYNDACRDCVVYVNDELLPLLAELGIEPVRVRDYLAEPEARGELFRRSREAGIPLDLQGHLAVFISGDVILEGHVPADLIREVVDPATRSRYRKILIYHDAMPGMGQEVTHYKVWSPDRPAVTYELGVPVARYLEEQLGEAASVEGTAKRLEFRQLLPIVLATGLADGVNPCAFAVLLLFLGLMFALRRRRAEILAVGGVFILMIYLAYLGIGLGLLRAITLFESPHFLAWVGAIAVIVLGLINVKDALWPGWGPSLRIPAAGHRAIERWLNKGTLTATAVGGFLVGLCTFPCSGGIYVAILGLLASETTFARGFGYLLAYNVAFVAPLIVILGFVSNRRTMGALSRWEARNIGSFKGLTGLFMIALGVAILLWLA